MSGEEQQDRKRKGSEPDATVVAPKKKFLAARAEAAAQDGAGGGGKGDRQTTSYSIKDNAPSGALNAESEEIIKFQNKQLYAAIEVLPPSPPLSPSSLQLPGGPAADKRSLSIFLWSDL